MIGKVIGAWLGYMFGSALHMPWIGFFFGLWVGSHFDRAWQKIGMRFQYSGMHSFRSSVQDLFFEVTFEVMGHIAKADGRISENDIAYAKQVMKRLNMSKDKRAQAMKAFYQGKLTDYPLVVRLRALKAACLFNPQLLLMFYEFQCNAAQVDGPISRKQSIILNTIAQVFGVRQQRYQQQSTQSRTTASFGLSEAYQILGVQSSSSVQEIKRAYRKQMAANHPDKLMSKGLPKEMIKLATEKTQKIKEAYDLLKQARNFK